MHGTHTGYSQSSYGEIFSECELTDKCFFRSGHLILTLPGHDYQYLVKMEFCMKLQLQKSLKELCETRIPVLFLLCSRMIKIKITKCNKKFLAFHLQCLSIIGQVSRVSSTAQLAYSCLSRALL